ncbi:hypothetical protein SAMN05443144_1043 [Fodinibius roseus]|uniref:Ribbon-helix-helix protein, copG family n=1 Tax=Fodinibius roseus TaxID=1194090 RepID=A0A1M4X2F3_9BACT|nr:ribbon-helix-helix protein, CopG family [Fodinibius roseus]SHE87698.1 hypothetical protein SAMN05443144_1043 [Fodinibius roseus]
MADDEFNIDELISGPEESGRDVPQSNTRNTSNTDHTSTTETTDSPLHPFSVRLGQQHVDVIKALAWWKRISQREFIEQAVDQYLDDINSEELKDIITQYHENN